MHYLTSNAEVDINRGRYACILASLQRERERHVSSVVAYRLLIECDIAGSEVDNSVCLCATYALNILC